MLILIDPEMNWITEPVGEMGRPAVFSGPAIQLCQSVKVLFKLPLRQVVGMVRARLKFAGLDCGPCRITPPCAAARKHWPSSFPIAGLLAC